MTHMIKEETFNHKTFDLGIPRYTLKIAQVLE